jgi:hypothetical protein
MYLELKNFLFTFKRITKMPKDPRYTSVRRLIGSGDIRTFRDIFDYIPKSVMAKDMGRNYATFASKVIHPDRFTLLEIFKMSKWIEVEPEQLITLVKAQTAAKLSRRKPI